MVRAVGTSVKTFGEAPDPSGLIVNSTIFSASPDFQLRNTFARKDENLTPHGRPHCEEVSDELRYASAATSKCPHRSMDPF